jgi:hypothetical protein
MSIETAFTLVQWLMVAPLTAVAFRAAQAPKSRPMAFT